MATRRPLARVNGRTRQLPAGDQLDSAVLANAIAAVLTGLVTNSATGILATDTIVQALGKLQAQVVSPAYLGAGPNQVPAVAMLGACALEDTPSMMLVFQHTPDAPLNAVWRERVSDTETVLKYRDSVGVVRSRQELWT